MDETELRLNKIAQGMIDIESGIDWFSSQNEEEQIIIMRNLNYMLGQSHPRKNDVEKGLKLSGLKPTYTPCVLILKKDYSDAITKILNLPNDERVKSFRLLLSIFTISDERRRNTECKEGCYHEWHNLQSL